MIENQVSATDVLEQDLALIHRYEPVIQAWTTLAEKDAREQARKLDAEGNGLPLFGQTAGVKDIIHVAGMPSKAGSRFLGGTAETKDARCVERLRKAGAVILGKTATTEFAYYDPAPTRNPRNTGHTPGGSSSGSAAAVAAGFCNVAIGTQTFGSVIRPASYCGVFALKPTYDAISREGVIPLAWSLDHVGMFTRSAGLAALCAEALFETGFPGEAPAPVVKENRKARIARLEGAAAGVPDRYFLNAMDATVRAGYEAGVTAMARAGIRMQQIKLPALFEPAIAAAGIILRVEAAASHKRWYSDHAGEYGLKLRSVIESGERISSVEYLKARQVQQAARRQMLELMNTSGFYG